MIDQRTDRDTDYYRQQGAEMARMEAEQRAWMRAQHFDTIAVHGMYGAQTVLANQGSIIEPAFLSSAQHFESSAHMEVALAYEMPSWTYTRIANPTLHFLEQTLALLEGYGFDGDTSACVTASGAAAVFMATNPFLVGEGPMNIVASAKCYGGTFMLFAERYHNERGIDVRWIRDTTDLSEWESQIDANTRFVYGEMPSNPALAVFDIAKLADIAHRHGVPLIVDSTVATPALMRPLLHGADIVIHSLSKSMTTSGFAIAGAVVSKKDIVSEVLSDEMRADFALQMKLLPFRDHGPSLSPFNALMVLNDLRTVRQKMDHLSASTQTVAEFLSAHPNVEAVNYPGLPDSPAHGLAKQYMQLVDGDEKRYGHLLSFDVAGGHAAARAFFDRLKLVMRATDLGRIKSIATIPAISTHQQQGDEGRDLAGIPANQVRLSIGGEHVADIMADLKQALEG